MPATDRSSAALRRGHLAARCASALKSEARLAQVRAELDALCASNRENDTCPGHCVRGALWSYEDDFPDA